MSKVVTFFKEVANFRLNSVLVQTVLIIFLMVTFIMLSIASYAENVVKSLADNLIRFHVVANSDSPKDQQLKLHVRDSIIGYMNNQLASSKDIEQTKSIIVQNISAIQKIAEEEIAKEGEDYKVTVSLGKFPFPTKAYGDVTLPAGKYEALQIVIGEGTGKNWWCVLFPPLCFVDATHGTISENAKNDLRKSLPAGDYNIITTSSLQQDVPIRIKFKIVEMYQQSQIKIAGTVSKLITVK